MEFMLQWEEVENVNKEITPVKILQDKKINSVMCCSMTDSEGTLLKASMEDVTLEVRPVWQGVSHATPEQKILEGGTASV